MSDQTPSFPPPDETSGTPAEQPPVSQDVPAPAEPTGDAPVADAPATEAPGAPQPDATPAAAPAPVPAPPPAWPQQTTPPAAPPTPPAYPPQAYPAGGYPPGGYPQHPETSTNAVIALVLAIVSWVVCPIIPAIVALFLANTATKEIAASGGRKTGEGLVTASKIVSWINIGVWGAAIVIGFFFFILAIVAGGLSSN